MEVDGKRAAGSELLHASIICELCKVTGVTTLFEGLCKECQLYLCYKCFQKHIVVPVCSKHVFLSLRCGYLMCEVCTPNNSPSKAYCFCKECNLYLCKECCYQHRAIGLCHQHVIRTLKDGKITLTDLHEGRRVRPRYDLHDLFNPYVTDADGNKLRLYHKDAGIITSPTENDVVMVLWDKLPGEPHRHRLNTLLFCVPPEVQ